ncbi:MAG TPA: aminoacyl-tRNA hydrolase, partial [Bacilli bacterium]|nr:aminoacyl-tRNA hydrolase [Bacilli bacterium]
GMANIMEVLKTDQIKRLRLGIGKDENIEAVDYVLGVFSAQGRSLIKAVTDRSADIITDYLNLPFVDFMSRYN